MALKKVEDETREPEPLPADEVVLVPMVLFDATRGEHSRADVHPTCVKAHKECGWMVVKG